jgi:hypothetical protein
VVFVVVRDEVETGRFHGVLSAEEGYVEVAHYVDLIRAEDDMGEFDGRDNFRAGGVEIEVGTHFGWFRLNNAEGKCSFLVVKQRWLAYADIWGRCSAYVDLMRLPHTVSADLLRDGQVML